MKGTRARNIWLLIGFSVLAVVLLTQKLPLVNNWIWWLYGVATVIVIVYSTLVRRLWARAAWLMVAGAVACSVASDAFAYVQDLPSSISDHINSVINILYLLSYALMIGATVVLTARRRRPVSDVSGMLDSAIVFVAAAMITATFLIYPLWAATDVSTTERIVLVSFAVLNLLLLATSARLWFATDRSVNRSVRWLCVALIIVVLSTSIELQSWLHGSALNLQDPSNLLTALGVMVFMITGATALDSTAGRPPAADIDAGLTARGRVLLMIGLSIMVPAMLLLVGTRQGFVASKAFVAVTVILTILLALRINLLIRGYRDAVRREHVLREINAGLMRTTSMADVESRLGDWAARLVEQPNVNCTLGTVEELTAAGIGPFGARVKSPTGGARYRTVVTVPGTRPQRRLVVETPELINSAAQASLAVLGQSVGMALERLALSRRVLKRETFQRLELLLHNASDVIALIDHDAKINYVSEAVRELTGQSPRTVVGRTWYSLFDDPALARGLLVRARSENEARGELVMSHWEFDDLLQENDEPRSLPEPERRLDVDVTWLRDEAQFVVTHHDVTERYQLEQQLAFQAFHDELTGLNNRAVFRDELVRAATRARRSHTTFAVLMIDLDDFKHVNDSLGHPAGDELLKAVARRLIAAMREGDTPVRLGGDEFAVILESAGSAEDAKAVAMRIIDSLAEPVILRGTEVVSGASIGIAVSDGSDDAADIERDADIALYDAKFSGKGRVALFRSDMHDNAVERLSMTNQLRHALDHGEIDVAYQPVVELATGAIAGFETLVRWDHPTRGALLPDQFVPLAEETGMIVEIGRFTMQRAVHDLAEWTARYPAHAQCRVTINISVRQLSTDDIATRLGEAIGQAGIAPGRIVVEVTESVLLPDDSIAGTQLQAIADLGVSIYIDDFGTGWSSLHYLRNMPISGVKLAQEFVTGLPAEYDCGLARAVLELSQSMGLEEVVAEGVETPAQREALLGMSYRLGQGFLMGRPLALDALHVLLAESEAAIWTSAGAAARPHPEAQLPALPPESVSRP